MSYAAKHIRKIVDNEKEKKLIIIQTVFKITMTSKQERKILCFVHKVYIQSVQIKSCQKLHMC